MHISKGIILFFLAMLIGCMPLIQLATKCYQRHQVKQTWLSNPNSLKLTKWVVNNQSNYQPLDEISLNGIEYDVIKVEVSDSKTILWLYNDHLETSLKEQQSNAENTHKKQLFNFFKVDAVLPEFKIKSPLSFLEINRFYLTDNTQNPYQSVFTPPPQG